MADEDYEACYGPRPRAGEWPAPPGQDHYLAMGYSRGDGVPVEQINRVTTRFVVRWADYYRARLLHDPKAEPTYVSPQGNEYYSGSIPFREGALPDDLAAREALVDEIFDWAGEDGFLGWALSRQDKLLLDADDGSLIRLTLTPDEYAELQDAWAQHGLPRDLYYPASETRWVVEPVEKYCGPAILSWRGYTPRGWAKRDPAAIAAIPVPTEVERAQRFADACSQFMQAAVQWSLARNQPGHKRSREESEQMGRLFRELHFAMNRAKLIILRAQGDQVDLEELRMAERMLEREQQESR